MPNGNRLTRGSKYSNKSSDFRYDELLDAFEELLDAFEELHDAFEKLVLKNKYLKNQIVCLLKMGFQMKNVL